MKFIVYALFLSSLVNLAFATAKPNILIIMVDDMGYSDIGCYGGEIETPNLDQLAASGIKFTQMYNTAKCYPTRASLMTGLYYQRTDNSDFRNSATIGEVLRPVGYNTWWSGKHHAQFNPVGRGFDHFYGLIGGASNHFYPTSTPRIPDGPLAPGNANRADWNDDLDTVPASVYQNDPDFYSTDAFTDKALVWLDTSITEEKPFFLYLAYTAPHWPLQAFPEDIAKYDGVYDVGYDAIRNARYQRQIELGLVDPLKQPLPAYDPDNLKIWENLSSAEKETEALNMQIYAAMVDRVDQNIGRVLQKLQDQGKLDNTLVLFFSDNGACAENPTDDKADPAAIPGSEMSFIAYGDTWAQVSNTPLRKWKQDSFEGGIATPFFATWPAGIAPQSGWNREPVHVIDVLPTMLEMAGASYPGESIQANIPPPDGLSLLPAFAGNSIDRTDPLFFDFSRGAAVRDRNWKIVRFRASDPWELYDMENDASETIDLASAHPDIVTLMENKHTAWLANCSAGDLSGSIANNFHTLAVNEGAGTGHYYTAGQQVPVSANPTPQYWTFVEWTGDTQYLASATSPNTTATLPALPAQNLSLTATYDNLPGWSTLTVNSGTGSGDYEEGQQVAIAATTGLPGMVFDQWIGDTQYLNTVTLPSALVTLPLENITLTATYVAFLSEDDFNSGGLSGGTGWSDDWTPTLVAGAVTNSADEVKLTLDAAITRSFANPLTNASLSFDWDLDRIQPTESGTVEVFNGSWTTVWTYNIKDDDVNGSAELTPSGIISLPAGITQIRFKVNANGPGDAFYVDNIKVSVNQAPDYSTWSTQNELVQGQQGDDDGDGNSNYFEFVAGLAPKNPSSVFTVKAAPVAEQPGKMTTSFKPIVSGRTYTVTSREYLTSGTWLPLSESTSSDADVDGIIERTVTDSAATEATKFYRIEISQP